MHMQYKVDPDDALALPSFRSLYLLTIAVGLLVATDVLLWAVGLETWRYPWGWNLSLLAALLGGARIVYGALSALLDGDVGADLALAIALTAAVALREYWVGAEVVLIALVGESLEAITFQRTHREIRRILELRPRTVRLRRDDQEVEVDAEQVQVGELAVVRPGERIPIDGVVAHGRSAVDQSSLTGESLPVDKGPQDNVYAGTMNQFGALDVRITAVGKDTTLGQVIQLVAEARDHKGRTERIADTLAKYFLPFVLICAAATFVATNRDTLFSGSTLAFDQMVWMPTLAVLVVTCPCALILATPAAVMAALAWLARRGVLITGGAALERLADVNCMTFDKTGTLTTGKLQVASCLPSEGVTQSQLLQWAAAAESRSEHLIARAIVQAASEQQLTLPTVLEFEALPGAGVAARIQLESQSAAQQIVVGNRRLMLERGVTLTPGVDETLKQLESAGQSPLLIACDQVIAGVVGVQDTVRPEAAGILRQLRDLGIRQMVMLTGDRRACALQVAQAVGLEQVEAELRPQEKAAWLAQRKQSAPDQRTAMVGDGVNDAPALATADVGVALAGVGSDLAAEAGDLILMGDPLTPLPGLVRLSRETVRVIRQNILLFAFAVNFIGIALTAWIMPTWSEAWMKRSPIAAALFHQAGSVLVLLNSMRLLWFERWRDSRLGRLENAVADLGRQALGLLRPAVIVLWWAWLFRRGLTKAAFYLVLAAYFSQVLVFVQPDEVAVVKRCGRLHAVLSPGLHLRLPPPWDRIEKHQPDRIRTIEIGLQRRSDSRDTPPTLAIEWNSPHEQDAFLRREEEAILMTGDQSLVEIGASIQYRIRDLKKYLMQVRDADAVLHAAAESALRELVAGRPLLSDQQDAATGELVSTGRAALERDVQLALQQRADQLGLGIEVLEGGVCLEEVHPPLEVVDAFRDVSSAFKDLERLKNEGDAQLRQMVIETAGVEAWRRLSVANSRVTDELWNELQPSLEGRAIAEMNMARAASVAQQEQASGEAARFTFTENARSTAPELTDWRMLNATLGQTLIAKRKLILDGSAKGRRHLLLGLPTELPWPLLPPAAAPAEH